MCRASKIPGEWWFTTPHQNAGISPHLFIGPPAGYPWDLGKLLSGKMAFFLLSFRELLSEVETCQFLVTVELYDMTIVIESNRVTGYHLGIVEGPLLEGHTPLPVAWSRSL